jgi:uncharacterized coiled-coil protein SlyX
MKERVVTGDVNEVSRMLGELAGTVKALTDQQSAVFRKMDEQNSQLAALNSTFSGYSQQTLASIAGADRRIYDLEEKHAPLDDRVDSLETFKTETETAAKVKTRQTLFLFGVGGASGGILSQVIDFFRGTGHT